VIKEIKEKYNKLTKEQQEKVLKKLLKEIKKYEDINIQQKLEEECILRGHDFTRWDYKSEIKSRIDVGERTSYNYKYETWTRTCNRCGFIDKKNRKPYELFSEKILNENVDETIKLLRKRINNEDI